MEKKVGLKGEGALRDCTKVKYKINKDYIKL